MPTEPDAAAVAQSSYQVRLHVGMPAAALEQLAALAECVVLVDALPDDVDGGPLLNERMLRAGFTNRSATARAVLDAQARKGDRLPVDIVTPAAPDGRFAVEDFLAAGAVVDALADLGLDFASPEAASACAAFTGLRGALAHLVSASPTGRAWTAAGRTAALHAATRLDPAP
jgi:hypothetical protein